jgi:DNA-binding transcriptional regulator YiaG
MAKIDSAIKSEITRLAKREVRSIYWPLKREAREMTITLSKLSRSFVVLNRWAKEQMHREEAKPKLDVTPDEVKASRLTPERIRNLRRKKGISQRELAILTGVTPGAVASWEKGKFKPQGEKKAALVALRKLKKREVKKLLAERTGPKRTTERSKTKMVGRRRLKSRRIKA